jgi:hypothetical protein
MTLTCFHQSAEASGAKAQVNNAGVAQGLEGLLSYGSTLCDRQARQ